jgi:hypothetical protein
MTDKETERQRLKDLGCVEFKTIADKIGQRFIIYREWCPNQSNIVLEVSNGWRASNAHGGSTVMRGDDLVLLSEQPLARSIYVDCGLDFKKHSEILKAGIA